MDTGSPDYYDDLPPDGTEGGARRRPRAGRGAHARRHGGARTGGCGCAGGSVGTALLVLCVIVVALAVAWAAGALRGCALGPPGARGAHAGGPHAAPDAYGEPFYAGDEASPGSVSDAAVAACHREQRERRSVHDALSRLSSTAHVDPLITGRLYAGRGFMRNIYAQRTAPGTQGLAEFSSDGGPGDVGVDVGPIGLAGYGPLGGFDDGLPEAWRLPSTPVRWYRPIKRDHYGPEGPTLFSEGLYSLWEPDHDPLVS